MAPTILPPGSQLALGTVLAAPGQPAIVGRYSTGDGLLNLLTVEYSTAPLTGDYDLNNRVDGRDFLLWQRTLGATVPIGTAADGDNSGKIDAGDLTVWRGAYSTSAAAAVGVPEPASAALVGAAAALLAGRRPCGARRRLTPRGTMRWT